MRFRLQFSVAVAFAVLSVIVLGVAIGLFYYSNRNLALETARSAMGDARARTDAALLNVVATVGRSVEMLAILVRSFPDDIRGIEGMQVVETRIDGVDEIFSAFYAFDSGGAFYQVMRLPVGVATFRPSEAPVPAGATRVFRSVEEGRAGRSDKFAYFSESGEFLGEDYSAGTFDSRERPWYIQALAAEGLVVSPVYVFNSTGRPGITFSKRVVDADGRLLGVVGVDMELDRIAEILDEIRIGEAGEVFLLDRMGKLIAHSGDADEDRREQLAQMAIERWTATGSEFFRLRRSGEAGTYLASVAPLTPIFDIRPVVGILVPEQHFVGAINRATEQVLVLTAVIMMAAILATMLLARLLSRPLRLIAEEARRISEFDLEGDFMLESRIIEVRDLAGAVANMKNSLFSFGAYVPRDLVRSIVSTGTSVKVGGTMRELSILFSDIEGFTRKTEGCAPESVMRDLSGYFETMEAAISAHHGTVDKYIGDAIMAIWNAPAEDPQHIEHACRAALACRAAEARLNAKASDSLLAPTRTRFGLHVDDVIVGNVGSSSRLQYTALGGAVNLASRLEVLNKVYGTSILITQNVFERTSGLFVFRAVDRVAPAGTTVPIIIHELVGEAGADAQFPVDDAVLREIESWNAFYQLYREREWAAALAALEELRGNATPRRLVALYEDRCARFIAHPPGDDWDGVEIYESK